MEPVLRSNDGCRVLGFAIRDAAAGWVHNMRHTKSPDY